MVAQNSNNNSAKYTQSTLNDINVAIGQRIKRSRNDGDLRDRFILNCFLTYHKRPPAITEEPSAKYARLIPILTKLT
jgi:hypothetical protein